MEQNTAELAIRLADGRTINARPAPEDQGRLAELMAGGRSNLLIEQSALDTEGHTAASDVAVDVEGHALTLRLPSAADAVAVRRALAAGAITATIVAAGAVAALQNSAQQSTQAVAPVPAAPIVAPAPAVAPASQAEQDRDLGVMDLTSQSATSNVQAPAPAVAPASQAEQDRDLGIMDLGAPAADAPAAPAAAPAADRAAFREERLAERDPLWGVPFSGPSDSAAAPSEGENPGTHGPERGELERNP